MRVNRAVNDNLQQQAQAIYASMFVDNAEPTWKQGHLSDFVIVRYGKDHKKLADGIYPVYGSGGIMRHVERPLYDKESVLIPRKGTLNNVMSGLLILCSTPKCDCPMWLSSYITL